MKITVWALAALVALMATETAEARPLRVMALDQCADQYALALAPDADMALSPRADDPDAWLKAAAAGRLRVRPTLETAVAFKPDVVLRYWGGDARLLARLERDGAKVLMINDATDFEGIRANIRSVSAGLRRPEQGEALIVRMDAKLATVAPTTEPVRSAQYLTPGGFTAGPGTLIDTILKAGGFRNAARDPGFNPVSVERVAMFPPARFVLGFFDQVRADWRGPGRHPVVRKAAEGHVVASLPAAALTCPGWFAADAAAMIGRGK